jgi:hypothetical protein
VDLSYHLQEKLLLVFPNINIEYLHGIQKRDFDIIDDKICNRHLIGIEEGTKINRGESKYYYFI